MGQRLGTFKSAISLHHQEGLRQHVSLCPNGFIPLGPKLGPCPTNRVALGPHIIFVPNRWQDDVPRFKRVFVSCAACIHVAYGCGIKFCGLDAAHSMHSVFRQGYHTFLTTRDGNNKILPLAWAICETESKETYTFFGDEVHAAGLGRYLGHKQWCTAIDRKESNTSSLIFVPTSPNASYTS